MVGCIWRAMGCVEAFNKDTCAILWVDNLEGQEGMQLPFDVQLVPLSSIWCAAGAAQFLNMSGWGTLQGC